MKEEVIVTGDALIFYNKSHLLPLTIVGKHIDARSAIESLVSKNVRIQKGKVSLHIRQLINI